MALVLSLILVSMTVMRAGAQQAVVRVVPSSYTVPDVGMVFSVNVTVDGVEDLFGYEFKLYYPNNLLSKINVTEGPFLKTGGVPTLFSTVKFTDNYNATHGLVNILCIRAAGDAPGVNGSGTLATIAFRSISTDGPRILHLADVALSDPNPAAIPFTLEDGEVTVLPELSLGLTLPLLITSTLAVIALGKKVNHRGIFHIV